MYSSALLLSFTNFCRIYTFFVQFFFKIAFETLPHIQSTWFSCQLAFPSGFVTNAVSFRYKKQFFLFKTTAKKGIHNTKDKKNFFL